MNDSKFKLFYTNLQIFRKTKISSFLVKIIHFLLEFPYILFILKKISKKKNCILLKLNFIQKLFLLLFQLT